MTVVLPLTQVRGGGAATRVAVRGAAPLPQGVPRRMATDQRHVPLLPRGGRFRHVAGRARAAPTGHGSRSCRTAAPRHGGPRVMRVITTCDNEMPLF